MGGGGGGGGNVVMFYQVTVLNTGVLFCRQVSSFLISFAMETKGIIPTLLHFFIFVQILLPNFG